MSAPLKKGRGALVRRLRREHGLTERTARLIIERAFMWQRAGSDLDTDAREYLIRARHGVCPRQPFTRCWLSDTPRNPRPRSRFRSLATVALALSSGMGPDGVAR